MNAPNQPAPNLISLLRRRADAHGDRLWARFLLSGEVDGPVHTLTWGALDHRARAIAASLQALCAPRDRVLMLFPPGLDFAAAWFGCLYAGLIAVPAYPPEPARLERTLPRLQAIAADAGTSAVLTIESIAGFAEGLGALAPELGALPWIAVDALPEGVEQRWRRPDTRGEDVAFLQYTSGSTGSPKGVMVSHANVLHNSRLIEQGFGNRRDEGRGVSWLPMFHDMGLIGNIAHPIDAGLEMTFLSPLDFLRRPMRWLEAISRFGGTISGGPDFAYGLCARKARDEEVARLDLRTWAQAYSGAEPVRAETLDAFARRFAPAGFDVGALYPTYGLAEATLFVSGGTRGVAPRRLSVDPDALARGEVAPGDGRRVSIGCGDRRLDGELVIVEPERRRRLPAGRVGEIWVRGPSVALGYWGQPGRTEEVFGARLVDDPPEAPTWLRTGDLGFLEPDGELHVCGRIKDLIILRGRNLYPEDIEAAVEAAAPALRPGAVVALGLEAEGGVAIVAELRDPSRAADPALIEALQAAVMQAVDAPLKAAVFLRSRGLPKTSSGKRQRHAAEELLTEGGPQEGSVLHRWRAEVSPGEEGARAEEGGVTALRDWMVSYLEAEGACPAGRVDPGRSLSAQGVDSMQLAALGGELERRLGFEVPGELLFGRSVDELAERLARGHGGLSRGEALSLLADEGGPDLDALSALPEDIRARPRPAGPPEHPSVLLTGATGFLGGYLLAELLERTEGDVVCLVRAESGAAGLARVRENLRRFGLWNGRYEGRLRVLAGDLALPRFGWSEGRFEQVALQVQAVYHCGAQVHWGAPLSALADVNVGGTREALRLAALGGGRPVHLVSSVGVFPIGLSPRAPFPEQAPLRDGALLRIGYFRSKWCAEKLAEQARARGVPVSIYRPGFISGDSRSGAEADSQGQLYCAFLEGCLQLGAAPEVDKVLDLLPVDFVAQAIAALSLSGEAEGRSFNLRNPQPMPQRAYYARLRAWGYRLDEVAYPRWRRRVLSLTPDSGNPLVRFQGYYRAVTEQSMRRLEVQMSQAMPVEDAAARALLERLGLRCPSFDAALLDRYLRWYVDHALITPPPSADIAPATPREERSLEALPARFTSTFADMMSAPGGEEGARLMALYDRAKRRQWDAAERIDWSQDLDPESPDELPDAGVPLFGSPIWARMTASERDRLRHHFQAWQLSQYMHGEQGALLAASKLVQQLPGAEGKLYAATQVMDEARHLEAFTRLLRDKFGLSYGVNRPLERLLGDVLSDSRWDMTCLGMQVLIEGLALAAFATMRQQSSNPLMEQVNAAVMEDEARHMAFGRLLLEAHYRELSDAEKGEREEFIVEACYALRDRFRAEVVWERLGLPVDACAAWMDEGGTMRRYRAELFSRVAPTVRAIGLMGPRVERAFADMGVLRFADAAASEAVRFEDRAVLSAFMTSAADAAANL